MPREQYRRELQALHDQVLVLGSMVDKSIDKSIESLRNRDFALARQVVDEDRPINRQRFAIEEQAIRLIATQQPMASDLRSIIAVLNIIVDLERIGDYSVGNARIALRHEDRPLLKPLIDLPRMADVSRGMLRRSLDAFVARDVEAAKEIMRLDDDVDLIYDQVYRELVSFMITDPQSIDRATWLLWAAHNLERTADRVTNICERIVYEVTGVMEEVGASNF